MYSLYIYAVFISEYMCVFILSISPFCSRVRFLISFLCLYVSVSFSHSLCFSPSLPRLSLLHVSFLPLSPLASCSSSPLIRHLPQPLRASREAAMGLCPSRNNPVLPGVAGLRNLGKTCYMNAGLQTLFHVPALWEALGVREPGMCTQAHREAKEVRGKAEHRL